MKVVIRRARPEEAVNLSALILRSKQSNGYDDAFMAQCVDDLRITSDDIETGMIWVAEAAQLVGVVKLEPDMGVLHGTVSSFFIDPDAKRQGVGKQMWSTVLEAAQDIGLTHLNLDADPEAVPFYEAMGFVSTRQTPSASIPGRFLPFMELDITRSTAAASPPPAP